MKKAIICLGVTMSFLTTVCFGAKVDPAKITVAGNSGRIVDNYVSPKADAPVIVYLQDIHVNYEAQKAIVAVLEGLIRDYGFDLVLLEGKPAGLVKDLKYLRKDAPLEPRIKAAEKLLKEGTIMSAGYLDIATNYDFIAYGVEDMELYKKETTDQVAIYGAADEMVKFTSILQNIASNLKLHIYTKEMRDLDDKVASYDKDEIGLVEYVKFLQGAAAANNIEVKDFANVALFIESANLEGQIDFPAVERERATVVDTIEKALTDKVKKDEFLANGLQFRTGDISQGAYYSYLKDMAAVAKIDISANKNLNAYTAYITIYEKINNSLLFKELDTLVNKIKEALIKTPEQRQLAQIDKGLSIISDMVNIKLVPDGYNYYQQNKAALDMDGWLKFMKENSSRFSLTNPVPDDVSILKTNLPLLEKFYAAAFERDKAFVANIKAALTKHNKDKAVFISGGFHTPNMTKLLKESEFSYVVVAPRVDVINDYSQIYKTTMKGDVEYLKTALPAPAAAKNTMPLSEAASARKEELAARAVADEARASKAATDAQAKLAASMAEVQKLSAETQGTCLDNSVQALMEAGATPTTPIATVEQLFTELGKSTTTAEQINAVEAAIKATMGPAGPQACTRDGRLYGLRINTANQFMGWDANGKKVYANSPITIEEDPVKIALAFPDIAKALATRLGISESEVENAARINEGFQKALRGFIETHERLHTWIDRGMPALRARITEQEEEDIVHALTMAINGIPLADAHQANISRLLDVARRVQAKSELDIHERFIADIGKMRTGALKLADLQATQPDVTVTYMDLYGVNIADELAKRIVEGETYGLSIVSDVDTARRIAEELATAVSKRDINGVKNAFGYGIGVAELDNLTLTDFVTFVNVLDQEQRRQLSGMIKEDPSLGRFSQVLDAEIRAVDNHVGNMQAAAFVEKDAPGQEEIIERLQEDIIRQRLGANSGAAKLKDGTVKINDKKVQGVVVFAESELYDKAGKKYAEETARAAVSGLFGPEQVTVIRMRDLSDFKKQKGGWIERGIVPVLLTKDMSEFTAEDIGQDIAWETQTLKPLDQGTHGLPVTVHPLSIFLRAAIGLHGLADTALTEDQRRAGAARIQAQLAPLALSQEQAAKITTKVIMQLIPGLFPPEQRFAAMLIIKLLPHVERKQIQEFMLQLIFAAAA